jgi:hypothetical protein
MIKFIITQNGDTDNKVGLGGITFSPSEKVYPIEVSALWGLIKNGRFERDAKTFLTTFCKEQGLDAAKYLGD